jgi:methylthioribose-1-phosphate isomerase
MNIDGKHYRTIWLNPDGWSVEIIDQTKLPFRFETVTLRALDDAAKAIATMQVRGAPLIGATAAYGVCLALRDDQSDEALDRACETLAATRPTAINLRWALDEMRHAVRNLRARSALPRPTRERRRFATKTLRPAGASASMVSASSARMPRRRRARPSTS